MIEEEKRVEVVETAGSDASTKMDTGAFDDGLRGHDLRNGT
jgi:hypothetical protein